MRCLPKVARSAGLLVMSILEKARGLLFEPVSPDVVQRNWPLLLWLGSRDVEGAKDFSIETLE